MILTYDPTQDAEEAHRLLAMPGNSLTAADLHRMYVEQAWAFFNLAVERREMSFPGRPRHHEWHRLMLISKRSTTMARVFLAASRAA